MKWSCLWSCLLVLATSVQATDGTFRGKIVDPPAAESQRAGWIFVQSRNHVLRRVEVSHAEIVFGEQVPVSQRRKCRLECLVAGQEVRVTAQQDSAGEWRAKKIEILELTTHRTFASPDGLPGDDSRVRRWLTASTPAGLYHS